MQLSPELVLKREILLFVCEHFISDVEDKSLTAEDISILRSPPETCAFDRVESLWEQQLYEDEYGLLASAMSEFNGEGVETNLEPRSYSRHYESKEVAYPVTGSSSLWLGWTYWYGGGKHGDPGAIDWMPDAYLLTSEVKMQPVRVFKPIEVKL